MDTPPVQSLLELAEQKFGELNPAERTLFTLAQEKFQELRDSEYKLFRAIANGEAADYQLGVEDNDKPENALHWGEERTLRSERLRWLCLKPEVWHLCLPEGIKVSGAKLEGALNLSFSDIEIPLQFAYCYFSEALLLQQARLRGLNLNGSYISSSERCPAFGIPSLPTAIDARGISVTGSIFLHNSFQAMGRVSFAGATIGGDLFCDGGVFINENRDALLAQAANVTGFVSLGNGFQAMGSVSLLGATIGGSLICDRGTFTNENGVALLLEGINVKHSVFLRGGFQATGLVSLQGAVIGENLDCRAGMFTNENGTALLAPIINVKSHVLLRDGFQAIGQVSLPSATIGGNLECDFSTLTNKNGVALLAQSVNVGGSILLRNGFQAMGRVDLLSATIGGGLECDRGIFTNENGVALLLEGINVKRSVFLRGGFQATGLVSLQSAVIGGNLDCNAGIFTNKNKVALLAQSVDVIGYVLLSDGFQAIGQVNLNSARIRNALEIARVKEPERMFLNLQFAKVQTLEHIEDSFPSSGNLALNGLVYESLGKDSPQKWDYQLRWLRLQPTEPFSSQPYEHLAKVLQFIGYKDEAIRVLIGKEHDQLLHGNLGWFGKFWKRVLGTTIAYGYRPERAIYIAIGIVTIGSILFGAGYQHGLITPTDKDCKTSPSQVINDCSSNLNYPKFDPFIYSLDVFLPIIDLRLKSFWVPNANKGVMECKILHTNFYIKWGEGLRYYFWIHIVLGWVLTTLWVAGFSGLVRNTNK